MKEEKSLRLFSEETLDFSDMKGISGGMCDAAWNGCIGLIACSCSGSGSNNGSTGKEKDKDK